MKPFKLINEQSKFIFNSVKKKGPVMFDKRCPKCKGKGKVYPENGVQTFHCYECGYQAFWTRVAEDERNEKRRKSYEDYPFGGTVDRYDIWRETR